MFDVTDPYTANLRHPDPPAEDFGGTSPTGTGVTPGPFLDSPFKTQEVSIDGAGTDSVNGVYQQQSQDSLFVGPGGATLVLNGSQWELRSASNQVLYTSTNFPAFWTVTNGLAPAPKGQFI